MKAVLYYPHRVERGFILPTVCVVVVDFLITGYSLTHISAITFLFATMGIIAIWLSKKLYDDSNMVILFEEDGLLITETCHRQYYIAWAEVPYAYYARNYKGHLFIVLSPYALDSKQVKNFVKHGANSSRMYFDSVVVIHIDELQNDVKVKEIVDSRLAVICD